LFLIASPLIFAVSVTNNNEQVILQQQRQRTLEQQLLPPTPDVRLLPPVPGMVRLAFPQEKPCFNIERVALSGQEAMLGLQPTAHTFAQPYTFTSFAALGS
jgi:hemolysin activation/secretion protein